jgi:integrase
MDLLALVAAERHAVLAWVRLVAALDLRQFHTLQRRVARLLRRANAQLCRTGARRVTLYTARHLFASAAKRCASPEEAAALLGHASIATASECYGRRARRHVGSIPAPDPELVQQVLAANRDRPAPRRPIFVSRTTRPGTL